MGGVRLLRFAFTVLASIAFTSALSAAQPKDGGTLTIGIGARVLGFDALTVKVSNYETAMVGGMIFGNFLALDPEGRQVPSSALAVEWVDDNKTGRIKLRPGVRFSDGSPHDADAVARHWTRMLDPTRNQAFIAYFPAIKEVVATDPLTVEFRLGAPSAIWQPSFSYQGFVYWAMPPQYEAAPGSDLHRRPIGSGPYMLQEWNPDGNMVLVRNPHYWDRKAQHFERIVLKFIPDENTRYAAVQNGDVDLTYLGFEQVRDARKNPKLQVVREPATGSTTVMLNLKAPPLDDVRVRQALAHAVDRSVDREVVFAGEVEMANSFWGPGSPFHCAVDYPSYDPGKARALLQDYGKPVKFTLRTTTSPLAVLGAELYQSFWKKVGIAVEIVQVQSGPAYIGPVLAGSYDAALWQVPDLIDPDWQVYAPYQSKSGANYNHIDNAVLDAALERGRGSLDPEVRKQAYCDFSRELAKYLPVLLRNQHVYAVVANARLRGITHLRFGQFWPADAWWEP